MIKSCRISDKKENVLGGHHNRGFVPLNTMAGVSWAAGWCWVPAGKRSRSLLLSDSLLSCIYLIYRPVPTFLASSFSWWNSAAVTHTELQFCHVQGEVAGTGEFQGDELVQSRSPGHLQLPSPTQPSWLVTLGSLLNPAPYFVFLLHKIGVMLASICSIGFL